MAEAWADAAAGCCAQVFSALDRAQRRMGFHHADLGLRNVMEHYPGVCALFHANARTFSK